MKEFSEERNRKIYFNVRGKHYETFESTLLCFPETLLGDRSEREKYFNPKTGTYVIDCPTDIFDAILFFYQSKGILSKSSFTSEKEFREILYIFRIMKPKESEFLYEKSKSFREKLWSFLEYPRRSKLSLTWAYFSLFVISVSVATICLESITTGTQSVWSRSTTGWFKLECVYIFFFSVEYLTRLYSAPCRKKFLFSLLGIIDLTAIFPFFIMILAILLKEDLEFRSMAIVRVLRLLQVLRIIKLSRYSSGLKILGKSIRSCTDQIISLVSFFMIGVVFSSSLIHLFEGANSKHGFESIPAIMWFVIISMTTVGYGDVVPTTVLGKIASVISIFIGTVLLFHLFLPIYLMHFSVYYTRWQEKVAMEERLKKEGKRNSQIRKSIEDFSSTTNLDSICSSCEHIVLEGEDSTVAVYKTNFNNSQDKFQATNKVMFRGNNLYGNNK